MKQLILWAGVSCVGKTHLMEGIQNGEHPGLLRELGLEALHGWPCWEAGKYSRIVLAAQKHDQSAERDEQESEITPFANLIHTLPEDKLLIHYDLYAYAGKRDNFKLLESLLQQAEKTMVVTLTASSFSLVKRTQSKLLTAMARQLGMNRNGQPALAWGRFVKKMLRLNRKSLAYLTGRSGRIYQNWFQTLDQLNPAEQWIIDTTGELKTFNPQKGVPS